MRISKAEAAANRGRVLETAGRLFREKGVDRVAVADLMKAAGLTHGGFYNHFESKEDLAAAACTAAFASAIERLERQLAEAGEHGRQQAFAQYVERYLARQTRDAPARSCPMVTLGTDAARHGAELKAEFAAGVRHYLDAFTKIIPTAQTPNRAEAIAALSTLIGALTLSRACAGADDDLADEVLVAVRKQLLGRYRRRSAKWRR
jgi:TetR/AcrR family transcriptional repressor of nem operon